MIYNKSWTNNPKNINPEDLCPFEYAVTERRTRRSAECCKDNGKTETTEELDKLSQTLEDKMWCYGEEWDMLMEKFKAFQQSSNEGR